MKPRWDGTRILFEIDYQGQPVLCAISRSALQELGGKRAFAGADLLKSFAAAEPRISAVAARLYESRGESASGIINVWSDDIEAMGDAPPEPAGVDHG